MVSSMIGSQEIDHAQLDFHETAEMDFIIARTAEPLSRRDAFWLEQAVRTAKDHSNQFVEINIICLAKNFVSGYSVSAFQKDIDYTLQLIKAVFSVVTLAVTLKVRIGWDDQIRILPTLALRAKAARTIIIILNSRSRCRVYKGVVDWSAVAEVSNAVSITGIANDYIVRTANALLALIASQANGVPPFPRTKGIYFGYVMLGHYETRLGLHGAATAALVAGKHFTWVLQVARAAFALPAAILTKMFSAIALKLLRLKFLDNLKVLA